VGQITSTEEIAEEDGREECDSRIEATEEPQKGGINFHVSMRDYTMADMEELIIEAAARQIIGRSADSKLAKAIEERVLAAVVAKADERIARIANDVMGYVLTPTHYAQKAPVTIGETLAHLGREYLEQNVTTSGELPNRDGRYYDRGSLMKRIDWIVKQAFEKALLTEVQKATAEASKAAAAEVRQTYANVVKDETDKLRTAIALAVAGDQNGAAKADK
jgi:hypothetical protein